MKPQPRVYFRRYAAADLDALLLQPAQAHLQAQLLDRGYAQALEACEAVTCVLGEVDAGEGGLADEEGGPAGEGGALPMPKVLACMGLLPMHPRRAVAWSLIARDCGPHFLAIHRYVRARLAASPYTRIEAHVDSHFAAGARWLRLLGFECETPQGMRGFSPEGKTCQLYARVREMQSRQVSDLAHSHPHAGVHAPARVHRQSQPHECADRRCAHPPKSACAPSNQPPARYHRSP